MKIIPGLCLIFIAVVLLFFYWGNYILHRGDLQIDKYLLGGIWFSISFVCEALLIYITHIKHINSKYITIYVRFFLTISILIFLNIMSFISMFIIILYIIDVLLLYKKSVRVPRDE